MATTGASTRSWGLKTRHENQPPPHTNTKHHLTVYMSMGSAPPLEEFSPIFTPASSIHNAQLPAFIRLTPRPHVTSALIVANSELLPTSSKGHGAHGALVVAADCALKCDHLFLNYLSPPAPSESCFRPIVESFTTCPVLLPFCGSPPSCSQSVTISRTLDTKLYTKRLWRIPTNRREEYRGCDKKAKQKMVIETGLQPPSSAHMKRVISSSTSHFARDVA